MYILAVAWVGGCVGGRVGGGAGGRVGGWGCGWAGGWVGGWAGGCPVSYQYKCRPPAMHPLGNYSISKINLVYSVISIMAVTSYTER